MSPVTERCALPPCSEPAVVSLRLVVEGSDSVLPACRRHADWLCGYAEEDLAVAVLDQVPSAEVDQ